MELIRKWFRKYSSDPQIVVLAAVLLVSSAIVLVLGDLLAPVIGAIVIAFLLEGIVKPFERLPVPRLAVVSVVFSLFMLLLIFIFLGLIPLLSTQVSQFISQLPAILSKGQEAMLQLPERYPQFISDQQVLNLLDAIGVELSVYGKQLVAFSFASVRSLFTLIIYIVLVPIMVFFFLKDKDKILNWIKGFLPDNHSLANRVWTDVKKQTGNYVRGKIWEIVIIWVVTYVTFLITGLDFAMLISFLVGISVIIPYVGATLVTFPVAVLAYFQWGWGSEFAVSVIAYLIIQILDGNLLVPLLLSEVVNLHPIAIITSILVFGGLWGMWGVFFAIPLATLVQAVISALRIETSVPAVGGEPF